MMSLTRIAVIFGCCIALVAVSCSKEQPPQTSDSESFSISAESGSKTAMADVQGSVVNWSEGDALSVFDNTGGCTGHAFSSAINPADSSMAVFTGEVCTGSTSIVALYPYDAAATYAGGTITTTLPSVQTAVNGSFASGSALCLSRAVRNPGEKCVQMTFSNLCAVLCFTMPSYIEDAVGVVISSNSLVPMSGSVGIDTENCAISSVGGTASVTLSGSLAPQGRYYACIAPGTYTDGFTLTVSTASGKSYSCRTTKTMNAGGGDINYIGTLGLVLDLTPKVTVTHTVDANGLLNGSDAVLSIEGAGEGLGALVTGWNVVLKNSDSQEVRRIEASEGKMSLANGWKYLPQGEYTIEACYNLPDGKTKKLTGKAVSPAPTFTVSTTGYASYDYYAATNGCSRDIAAANGCDAGTIYDLSASVSIISDIITDTRYSGQFTYNLDNGYVTGIIKGNTISLGDKGGMSWSGHTFKAECTFDGVTKSHSRTIHVTGLPYKVSSFVSTGTTKDPKANDNIGKGWVAKSWHNSVEDNSLRCGNPFGWGTSGDADWRCDFSFHLPENINVTMSCPGVIIYTYRFAALIPTTFSAQISGVTVFTQSGPESKGQQTYNLSGDGTLTATTPHIFFHSTYSAIGPYVLIHYINLLYR